MSFIGDIFSSDKGSGFQAQGAPLSRPVVDDQGVQAVDEGNAAVQQQQAFAHAVNAYNGFGNQATELKRLQQLEADYGQQRGPQQQGEILANQRALEGQLQGVANGTGPNPAAAMLSNATGNNVANQAALMAGQRGAGANAGLIARQAAQQGAATQQQAAGQAAVMQANQQLGALSQIGAQQQAEQGAAQAIGGQQASLMANAANLASQQAAQQQNATNAATSAQQAQQNAILNQLDAQNNSAVAMQSNINNANAGIAGVNAQGQQGIVGGAIGGIGGALSLAQGGEVPNAITVTGPSSNVGQYLSSVSVNPGAAPVVSGGPNIAATDAMSKGMKGGKDAGGKLRSKLSGIFGGGDAAGAGGTEAIGGIGASGGVPLEAMALAKGGQVSKRPLNGETMAAQGKLVPGQAKVKGNSYANDTVPAMLSPGEVVIPRNVMQSKDPVKNAAAFVAAIMAKHGRHLAKA